MTLRHRLILLAAGFLALASATASSQVFKSPPPGSAYREYTLGFQWFENRVTNQTAANNYPDRVGTDILLPNPTFIISGVDKNNATRAELLVTLWGGHTGSTPKQFRFNDSRLNIPELQTTPTNGECYMAFYNATVEIPLSIISTGPNELQGDPDGIMNQACWGFGWPQFIWYGVILRVYYNPSLVSRPEGTITSPASGSSFNGNLTVTATHSGGQACDRVDFLAYYDGFDTDGDGVFQEYHHDYASAAEGVMDLQNHLGTATGGGPSYSVTWNTGWLPDQGAGSVKLLARMRGTNGIWYVTPEVTGLTFTRAVGSVKLYKPIGVPENLWARDGRDEYHTVNIPVLTGVTGAQFHVRTWNGQDGGGENRPATFTRIHNQYYMGGYGRDHGYSYDVFNIDPANLRTGSNDVQYYSESVAHHGVEIMYPAAAVVIAYDAVVPVQLASFTGGVAVGNRVRLDWTTASEVNNFGFEVQKAAGAPSNFSTIPNSFVAGHGTTLEPQHYTFTDPDQFAGLTWYRLKQIDLDNSVQYSEAIRVDGLADVAGTQLPTQYQLSQNHPNPFNPSTTIRYAVPAGSEVSIRVYDLVGNEVATLVSGFRAAGYHQATFDASRLSSGVYLYRMRAGSFSATRRLVLVK